MPASPHRPFARALAVVIVCVVAAAASPAPLRAQESDEVSISLVAQPIWHEPGDPFNLRLRITNNGLDTLDGFRLQVRVFDRARSRSALHDNFDVEPTRVEIGSLPVDRPVLSVLPGASTIVRVDDKIDQVGFLESTASGVYPVTVTVTDTQGLVALDTLTTQLIYMPSEVEVPLNLAFVWPLSDLPSRAAEGVFEVDPTSSSVRLETALGDSGWLTGIADALALPAASGLRFGFAPEPRLIEELADMSDGYIRSEDGERRTISPGNVSARTATEVLERLRATVAAGDIQPILTPYSLPDLPSLDDLEQLSSQLTAGEAVLEEQLRAVPGRAWIFPPGGRLDEPTLERLHSSDAGASLFFSDESLEPPIEGVDPACRADFLGTPYTCPVAVTTASGRSRGFVLDVELQERFAALKPLPGDPVLFQRLFAEIAMIWAELPGTAERVIAVAAPPLWHPPPRIATRFIRTLGNAPWIRAVAPRAGLHLGIGAIDREAVAEAEVAPTQPDTTYLEAVEGAIDVVESFARLEPPADLIQRLRRDVLVAQSRMWWGDALMLQRGAAFADDAQREALAEMGKISIGGREDITLTSSTGPVPLVLENKTDYEVTLEIHIESSDRDLELSAPIITDTFEPGATPLPVEASARASGIYPVRVLVAASDGYEVFETSIRIRSTEFNEIALGITVGALAFLVMFYVFRSGRRRRSAAAIQAGD